MRKKELFRILFKTHRDKVISLGERIIEGEKVKVIKEPDKTLVMVKMKDPVVGNPFYLGEVLCSESIVEVSGFKGMAVTMGDDFNKVLSMAVIDGALNGNLNEKYNIAGLLNEWKALANRKDMEEFSRNMDSRVDFSVMEE